MDGLPGIAALELNISCPNVSHGVDLGVDPEMCRQVVAGCRSACDFPIIAKLTPNVTNIAMIARAAADGGADAISAINTLLGMAVDWRRRRPMLGNVMGGLSGPAIKPLALRCVIKSRGRSARQLLASAASPPSTMSWSFSSPEQLQCKSEQQISIIQQSPCNCSMPCLLR